MSVMLRCIVLCALIAYAVGHSVLSTPTPVNANPTKTAPCGLATMPAKPVAAAQWAVGVQQTIQWKLVATDGGKTLSAVLDTTGAGTNAAFAAATIKPFAAQAFGQKGTGVPTPVTFTIPAGTSCANSPSGLCVLRMVSDTAWNSCIYVNITNVVEPPAPTPAPKCTLVNTLTYCTMLNGEYVTIAAGTDANSLDSQVKAAVTAAINETEVFSIGGKSADCYTQYKDYMCRTNLVPCGNSLDQSACTSDCQSMTAACGLTEVHKALYPCTGLPSCNGGGADGSSATLAQASAAVLAAGAIGAAFL